jgi:hypothetical protein
MERRTSDFEVLDSCRRVCGIWAMKESPEEIGFVIGGIVGFIWLVWAKVRSTRNGGTANYLFIMLCGGIGWGYRLANRPLVLTVRPASAGNQT